MLAEIACKDVADRVQVRAAMMGHDTLGIARGARRVGERDRVPLVFGRARDKAGIALRQHRLIFNLADTLSA